MQLVFSVFALTVAALTLVLAGRRLLALGSQLVFSRFVAVGGMVAISVGRTDSAARTDDGEALEYHLYFKVGGPGVFHNVSVHVLGLTELEDGRVPVPPPRRHTMSAGDDPIDWTFAVADPASTSNAWVLVTWVRPYLEGIDSEAVAQWLDGGQLYEWRWYTETTRLLRTGAQHLARRYPRRSPHRLRDMGLYGRWRRTASSGRIDMLGPADGPPPA